MVRFIMYVAMMASCAAFFKPAQAHITAEFNTVFDPIKEALDNVN